MKFSSIIAVGSALISTVLSQDVGCFVNGNQVAVVDLDTGVCPFSIPSNLPAPVFRFVDENDYTVQFYYSVFEAIRYFTDIVNAGNIISIPANILYNGPALPLFSVSAEETPAANSTAALRRRFLKDTPLIKRETVDEFVAGLKELNGTLIDTGATFEVRDPIVSSSATLTIVSTSISTISCPSGETTHVAAVPTVVTTTVSGVVTEYTTWCPLSTDSEGVVHTLAPEEWSAITSLGGAGEVTVTQDETTIVTITSCVHDACHETTVPATKSIGTTTVHGVETVYTTWCPVSETAAPTEGKPVESSSPAGTQPVSHAPVESAKTITVTKPISTSVASSGTQFSTTIIYQTITTVTHGVESHASVESAPASVGSAPAGSAPAGSAPVGSAPVASAPAASHASVASSAPAGTHVTVEAQSGTPAQPTVAAQSGSPAASAAPSTAAISTYEGSAASYGASFLAIALIPLAFI